MESLGNLFSRLSSLLRSVGTRLTNLQRLLSRNINPADLRFINGRHQLQSLLIQVDETLNQISHRDSRGLEKIPRRTQIEMAQWLEAAQLFVREYATPAPTPESTPISTPESSMTEIASEIQEAGENMNDITPDFTMDEGFEMNINELTPNAQELERTRRGIEIINNFYQELYPYLNQGAPFGELLTDVVGKAGGRRRIERMREYHQNRTWSIDFTHLSGAARRAAYKRMIERILLTLPVLPIRPNEGARYGLRMTYVDNRGLGHVVTYLLNAEKIAVVLETLIQYAQGQDPVNVFTGEAGSDTGEQLLDSSRLYRVEMDLYNNLFYTPIPQQTLYASNASQPPLRSKRPPGFFNYFNKLPIDLSRYQIATGPKDYVDKKREYETNCFIWALKISKQFSEQELEEIILQYNKRRLNFSLIKEITVIFNFGIDLHRPFNSSSNRRQYIGPKGCSRIIPVGIINEHAFLIEPIECTSFYIKNFEKIQAWNEVHGEPEERLKRIVGFRGQQAVYGNESRFINSYKAILLCTELYKDTQYWPSVTVGDVISLAMSLHRCVSRDREYLGDLEYDPKLCLKPFKELAEPRAVSFNAVIAWPGENQAIRIFYADFETFTNNIEGDCLDQHEPFMICCGIEDEADEEIYTFTGPDCGKQYLEWLDRIMIERYKNECPLIYFHNLGYDINFLAKYGISASLPRGRRMLSCEIRFNNHIFTFKDSLSLIPAPLRAFGSMFHLTIEKEVFPYRFYCRERFYAETLPTQDEVIEFMKEEWSSEEGEHLKKICQSFNETEYFPMLKYAEYYCKRDVEVLRDGMRVFRQGIWDNFGLNAINYLSISSIADAVFLKEVYSKTDHLFKVGGIVREFMQRAIHGGRVMPAENKKWAYKLTPKEVEEGEGLVDFDAVSLYPSAMSRLWIVTGEPKVLSFDDLTQFETRRHEFSAYVVEIEITAIHKPRQFPLVLGKDVETGSVLNTNEPGLIMTVCDIELEDLIRYQEIEYVPLRGYYWTERKIFTIQECIRNIFEKRVEYKKQKNPLETLYKLIMNSVYGKTILKPTPTKITYVQEGSQAFKTLIEQKSYDIDYIEKIIDSDILAVKHGVPVNRHYNFSLFGIHILAMSKRIMNEVMTLAEDLGMKIYYQDTDSMHIDRRCLEHLAEEFKKRYGRDLIGTQLGQFHPDFDLYPDSTNVRAIESYFIGKKCYLDKLIDDQGRNGWHIRLKGIPKAAIEETADVLYDKNIAALYKDLAIGEKPITFNLLAKGRVAFETTKGMTIHSREKFERTIIFNKTPPPDNYKDGKFYYIDKEGNKWEE